MSGRGRRVSCSAAISSLSVSERLAYPQSTGLWLDALAARLGSEQRSALYRGGPSPFAEGGRLPSGVHILLERLAAPAHGCLAQAGSPRSSRGQRPPTVSSFGGSALPSRHGARRCA